MVEIDYDKYKNDDKWDGLKGYITNSKLSNEQIMENYANLWHIEKAFRMSKTDLRIRPIYHRLKHRIEAHICISFAAYSIYKELESVLYKEKSSLSLKKASELTHNMYQITYTLPDSKHTKSQILKMDEDQTKLYEIINQNFQGVAKRKTGVCFYICFACFSIKPSLLRYNPLINSSFFYFPIIGKYYFKILEEWAVHVFSAVVVEAV